MPLTGMILNRLAGQALPTELLEKAVTENPTAWGVALVTPDGLITSSGPDADGDNGPSVELITGTVEQFAERNIHFYLCNSESAINMDDVSPHWIVEGEDGLPRIVAFVEGQFGGFERKDSSHPTSYHFVQDHLIPEIKEVYDLVDGNLPKIMTLINKDSFKKKLMGHATSAATITFVMADGEATTLSTSKTSTGDNPWGWASEAYGFGVEPVKAAEPAKKSMIPNKSTTRERHIPPAIADAVKPPVTSTSVPKVDATGIKNYTIRDWAPKAGRARKDRKKDFQAVLGYAPKGFHVEGFKVKAYFDPNGNVMSNSDIKRMGLDAAGLPPLNNPGRESDVEPDEVESDKTLPAQPDKQVTTEILPIMSPKAREWAKEFIARADVKKLIAENAKVISDPGTIKQIEQKHAGFGEQLGGKDGLKDWARLDYPRCLEVIKNQPEVAGNLLWNLLNIYRTLLAAKETKLTGTETHQLAKEELTPSKKSMIPNKKVA